MSTVSRKRHAQHADERWLLTYADMITLLMALFMVLFSISVVNKGKFDELAKALRESFAGPLSGGKHVNNTGAPNPQSSAQKSSPGSPVKTTPPKGTKATLSAKALQQAQAKNAAEDRSLKALKALIDARI